ncbi:MAG: HNH endonuclease [Candidatus Electrothrix sp. AX5]|nr:HNH endonuclease [Candidatus Electrothrix sp. AX5]
MNIKYLLGCQPLEENMEFYLRIRWIETIEYINIDLSSQPDIDEITETQEFWTKYNITINYITASTRKIRKNCSHEIRIIYSKDNNPHLLSEAIPEDIAWGSSKIIIRPDFKTAEAFWREDIRNPKHNGKADSCSIYSKQLFEEMEREAISRLKRKQNEFRKLLLSTYKCCVITGETTPEAIEAAHVYEKKMGGNDLPNNGILLRTDLHRLYDARLFRINNNGSITANKELSTEYKKLLKSSVISAEVIKNIEANLLKRG